MYIEVNEKYGYEYDVTSNDVARAIYWVIDNNYLGDNKKVCKDLIQDWNLKCDKKWFDTLDKKTRKQAIMEMIEELDIEASGFMKFYKEDIDEDIKENAVNG